MSYQAEHQRQFAEWIRFIRETLRRMEIEKLELASSFAISVFIGVLILRASVDPTIGVTMMTVVHSVQLPRLVRAWWATKREFEQRETTHE